MWVLFTAAVNGGCIAQRTALPASVSKCTGSWSLIEQPSDADRQIVFDNMDISRWRGAVAVVGDPAVQLPAGGSGNPSPIGVGVWPLRGRKEIWPPFAEPVSIPLAMYPRIATTTDGRLHVVYGLTKDVQHRTSTTSPDGLWFRSFNGTVWTKTEPLPPSRWGDIWWDWMSASSLVSDGGALDIIAPVKSRDSTTIILFHRSPEGPWAVRPIVTGGQLAVYTRLVRLGSRLVMSYAAPDPTLAQDRSSVFAMYSDDDGLHWSPPERIHLAGIGATYDHTLMAMPDGRLFLLWQQESGDRPIPIASLAVATSSDSGRTWKEHAPLRIEGGIANVRFGLTKWGPLAIYAPTSTLREEIRLFAGSWMSVANTNPPHSTNRSPVFRWTDSSVVLVATERVGATAFEHPAMLTVICK